MDSIDQSEQGKARHAQRLVPLTTRELKMARYQFRLFVAGTEANSAMARENLLAMCSERLKDDYTVQEIDVFEDFAPAIAENIVVTPALIMDKPRRVIIFGNLKETDKVLAALELK